MSENSNDKSDKLSVDDILDEYPDTTDNPPADEKQSELDAKSIALALSFSLADERNLPQNTNIPADAFDKPVEIIGDSENYAVSSEEIAFNSGEPEVIIDRLNEETAEEIADEPVSPEETSEAVAAEADTTEEEEIFDDEAEPSEQTEKSEQQEPTETHEDAHAEEEPRNENISENSVNTIHEDIPNAENAAIENEAPAEENKPPLIIRILKYFLPWKGDKAFEIIRKLIFLAAIIVFVGAGVMLASTLVQSRLALKDEEQIKEVVTTTVATTIDSNGKVIEIAPTEEEKIEHNFDVMTYYKDINEDVVGYIELEGCNIYQPVVQSEDNSYYLTHTYYDGTNKAGAIFLDFRCRIEEDYTSPNLVVYGHNQEDGTMFGNLKNYKQNAEFYAANPTVTFNTEYGLGTYVIYGFFVTAALDSQSSTGKVFHYQDYIETLNDESTFKWYMNEVQKRNQLVTPIDVQYGDKLLCLSTCSNEFSNSRFVVFARKLRDGESTEDYDFTQAYVNYAAQGVDWDAITSNETTTETTTETTSEISEETTEEITEEATEETSVTTTVPTMATEETTTQKTKRVQRTEYTTTAAPTETELTSPIYVTDENGLTVTDENGMPVTNEIGVPVTDESGLPVTDESGFAVTMPPEEQSSTVTAGS